MGCDIHCMLEIKRKGVWLMYNQCDIDRSYALFTKMANVRTQPDIKPIAEPKGWPRDASEVAEIIMKDWDTDGHSHSWLDYREIIELFHWYKEQGGNLYDFDKEFGYLFGGSIYAWKLYPEDEDCRPWIEDVRLVFFFDN